MKNKLFATTNFKISIAFGVFLIVLVAAVGISFFWAIYSSQLERRQDFLGQQTDLAGRGLENELNRFEEESRLFVLELEEQIQERGSKEFGKLARKAITAFPSLIDTLWIANNRDSVWMYVYTQRNDFIQQRVPYFPKDSLKSQLYLQGKSGLKVLYSTNLRQFSKQYLVNFYQVPGGGNYLFQGGQLLPISAEDIPQLEGKEIQEFEGIKKDLYQGIKGLYPVTWKNDTSTVNALLAQYPFSFGELAQHVALVMVYPIDDLSSGIYKTYFLLFSSVIVIMVIILSFFVISLKNYLELAKTREDSFQEISRLFEQQNMLLKELRGFVFFHNYKGEILRVSEEVEEVLGYTKKEFNQAFSKDSSYEIVELIKEEIKKAFLGKREFLELEYNLLKKDGKTIRIRVFEKIIIDEQGRFDGGLGICTDITEQYAAQMKIIQNEDRLRSLINNLPDEIFIYDNEGKVLDFHIQTQGNYLALTGAALGKKLQDFVPADQREELDAAFQKARATGQLQTAHVSWSLEGEPKERHYETRFFPLDEQQMVSISKDITNQKIWEKGILEAMHAAEQANKSKSEFLANMSHEIRTPLNGLLGMIDLLEGTQMESIQKQYLDIIKNSGNSLLSIIRDILDYSKIEAGKMELHPSTFDPKEQVKAQVEILGGVAKKKDISLDVDFQLLPDLVVEADRDKINQVLLNLIGNALKFTPNQGLVSISLSHEPLTDELILLNYSVSDNGIGISKEHLLQLTDPFFQVESSASRSYQGAGLGLAIAKRMVELLGGELKVDSSPGKGATFRFSVVAKLIFRPLVSTEIQHDVSKDRNGMAKDFPLRILLAEDNELNLQLMGMMFDKLGYTYDVAKNGREALEKVSAQPFDMVFMDVQMPVMNGLEATSEIRKLPKMDSLIIIGLSANAFEDDQRKALEMGMNDYLTKPVRLTDLAGKLEYYYRNLKLQPQGNR
ncbi:MAG: ATP-binding protein [Bacteroidota bacterium]|jgi:PAS domain S-box-containing protein